MCMWIPIFHMYPYSMTRLIFSIMKIWLCEENGVTTYFCSFLKGKQNKKLKFKWLIFKGKTKSRKTKYGFEGQVIY